jgi:hypothetical protein
VGLTSGIGWAPIGPMSRTPGRTDRLTAATALALTAGVTLRVGCAALVAPLTVSLAVVTVVLRWRTRINTAWYIGAAGLIGIARELVW